MRKISLHPSLTALTVVAAGLFWTAPAIGQTPVELVSWEAPATCPPMEEVQQRLSELQAGGVMNAKLQAGVFVEEDANGFRLRLETNLDGLTGERILEGPTCDEVTQAAIAVLALLLDAEAQRAEEPPPPPPPPTPVPRPAPRKAAPRPSPPPPQPRRTVVRTPAYVAGLGLGVGRGVLPSTAVVFETRLGLRWPAWSVQALGQLWPERAAHSTTLATAGVEFSMVGAGLLLCRELLAKPIAWRLCAGAEADWLLARGFGVDDRRRATAFTLALDFGTALTLKLAGGLALAWNIEGVVPTSRPRFVLDNVGAVFERPFIGGRTTLGLELAFDARPRH